MAASPSDRIFRVIALFTSCVCRSQVIFRLPSLPESDSIRENASVFQVCSIRAAEKFLRDSSRRYRIACTYVNTRILLQAADSSIFRASRSSTKPSAPLLDQMTVVKETRSHRGKHSQRIG